MRIRPFAVTLFITLAAASPATTLSAQGSSRATAPDSSWVSHSAIYEVFVRDFSRTGDFKGVTQGLDRIQAVGANVVWLMPIYPVGIANRKGTLGSPYAVRDYMAVNPEFGTMADFKALVQAVHARRMKLILDWVPNHTAWDNVWVKQHPAFYVRNDKGGLTVPRDDKGNLTDWTDVAQLNYKNPEMRRAMIDAMRRWLIEFGIDGFAWTRPASCRRLLAGGIAQGTRERQAPNPTPREWGDVKMHRFGFDMTYAWDSYAHLKAVWTACPPRDSCSRSWPISKRCRQVECGFASRRITTRRRGTSRRSRGSRAQRGRARVRCDGVIARSAVDLRRAGG